jgi:hypothetical protein
MKRASIALYYANQKGRNFKFQHHILESSLVDEDENIYEDDEREKKEKEMHKASHGDPIFTDTYVEKVVVHTVAAIRSQFFGIYNFQNGG